MNWIDYTTKEPEEGELILVNLSRGNIPYYALTWSVQEKQFCEIFGINRWCLIENRAIKIK